MTTSLITSEQGNYVIKPFPFNQFLYPVQGPTGYPLRFLTVCLAILFWLTSFSVQAEIPSNPCTPPSLTITANPSLTVGLNASLVLTATGAADGYVWSNLANTAGIIHPTSVTGTTVYSVTGTTAGCQGMASVTVVVANCADIPASSLPSLTVTATPSLTVNQNVPMVLTATGSTGGSYLWSTGANTAGITPSTSTTGTFTYWVRGTMAGCPAQTDVTIVVRECPPAPVLAISASTVCEGTSVQVTATVSGPITGYQWFKNPAVAGQAPQAVSGKTSATLSLGSVVPAQAGSYSLVISSDCGSFTSNAFTLTVNPLPTVTLTVPQGSTVVGPGTGVATITVPTPLTGFSFQAFGGTQYERFAVIERLNGYEIRQVDTNTTGIFNVTQPGPFRLIVTSANGCQRTVEGVVMIQP